MTERRHEWTDPETGRTFTWYRFKVWEDLQEEFHEANEESEQMTRYAAELASRLDAVTAERDEAEAKQRTDEAQCDMMTEDAGNFAMQLTAANARIAALEAELAACRARGGA